MSEFNQNDNEYFQPDDSDTLILTVYVNEDGTHLKATFDKEFDFDPKITGHLLAGITQGIADMISRGRGNSEQIEAEIFENYAEKLKISLLIKNNNPEEPTDDESPAE